MQSQDDDIIPRLWTAARAMFARMCAAVGEAAAIAARQTLSAAETRAIRKWLSPLEAMARKVVIVEAIALIERGAARSVRGDTHARSALANLPADADMRVCHPASHPAPPAVTLIALPPPPVRILTRIETTPPALPARERAPSLRLWPCARANAGPHARDVGPNLTVRDVQRDRARLIAARRMQSARALRRPESERLARRIEALARILAKPLRAARRLARKLIAEPLLALKLARRRPPRSGLGPEPEYTISHERAVNRAYDFGMKRSDSS